MTSEVAKWMDLRIEVISTFSHANRVFMVALTEATAGPTTCRSSPCWCGGPPRRGCRCKRGPAWVLIRAAPGCCSRTCLNRRSLDGTGPSEEQLAFTGRALGDAGELMVFGASRRGCCTTGHRCHRSSRRMRRQRVSASLGCGSLRHRRTKAGPCRSYACW